MDCKLVIVIIINFANADWVEISQSSVPQDQIKQSKRIDFTTFILTTTSSTTQTPAFDKPAAIYKKHNEQNNETLSIVMQANKVVNKSNDNKVNAKPAKKSEETRNVKRDDDTNAYDQEKRYGNSDEENEDMEENNDNDKGFSYSYFIPYLSTIQKTLMQNTHNNKKSKLAVLLNLRDHLLAEIKNRITSLWNPNSNKREAREYKEESHVDFPSNEGALVTIGFLTFAVFLIKLVLQLIQNVGSNSTTTTAYIGRKRRSTDYEDDTIRILSYLDQYRFK